MSSELVSCDLSAPQPPRSVFRDQAIPRLSSTPRYHPGLCDRRWQWYYVEPTTERTRTSFSREVGADGVTRTVMGHETLSEPHAIVLSFDSVWTLQSSN